MDVSTASQRRDRIELIATEMEDAKRAAWQAQNQNRRHLLDEHVS